MRTTNRVAENNRGLFLHTSGSWKSGVKVSVGLALPRDSEGRYGPCPSPCFLTTASVRAWLQNAPPLAHAFNTQAQIAHCYEDCGTFSRWDLAGESRPQGVDLCGSTPCSGVALSASCQLRCEQAHTSNARVWAAHNTDFFPSSPLHWTEICLKPQAKTKPFTLWSFLLGSWSPPQRTLPGAPGLM